ncbi:3-oxoacyl-[acyl-carrier-protein] synthase II [Actinopolyspora alba]|uniref:3-oxoacyl-[acyl-carrier-protein] synthase II n=1 Tax=Actinopolyspora alba TaxID=673379 RepID=A0A1I1UQ78_9ACTN|nr:beta-ketoacyl-[acyl-carrier-protein] synthase family protein [Actinopolyspora alba]SFD72755.1 3-oxoacyl-[acyl-carrier-protein] synthase II [Actinopolyspora alba]
MSDTAPLVTGIGLVSPAGIGVDRNWQRITEAVPATAHDPVLAGLPVDISCRVPEFDPDALLGQHRAWRLDRYAQLALVAAKEALETAGVIPGEVDPARVAVVLGTGAGGTTTMENQQTALTRDGAGAVSPRTLPMGLPNMASGEIAIEFGFRGPVLTTSTACASGATAIGVARDLLRSGTVDLALAGGTEAVITPLFVTGFHRIRALSRHIHEPREASRPFSVGRDGFVIGEGAGMLVLERSEHARGRDAPRWAHLAGYGATADAHHPTAPAPDGAGAEAAMRAALTDADIAGADISHVNAHGTSTRLNDALEADVVQRVLGDEALVTSTKGVTGHTLGAAGALEAAYTALALQHGTVPPTANLTEPDPGIGTELATTARSAPGRAALSNSFGFGGHNTALVLTCP